MEPYKNFSGNSGVREFEIHKAGIILRFGNEKAYYVYNYDKPGKPDVEQMKKLARIGKGLTTYINQNVRGNYADRVDPDD